MTEPTLPPNIQLIQMGSGMYISRIVYAAAKLGIADHLADGAKSGEELASPVGAHPRSLHRLMRTLANFGILTETSENRFALTPLGEALKSDAPGAARNTIVSLNGQWHWKTWEHFLYSLETGKPATDEALGMNLFEYFAQHPEEASLFSQAMVGIHGPEPPTVAAAYDFSVFDTIVDVGGATGNMLINILSRHAHPRGLLYDRPHVVTDAPAFIAQHGLSDRIDIQSGNFFESVPSGGDAYILSHIIHDWTVEECLTILGHIRQAMNPNGKVLIVEFVLPEGDTPHFGKLADMIMLATPGGEERTAAEYDDLLAKAGFRMNRVVPTESPVSVVEASIA